MSKESVVSHTEFVPFILTFVFHVNWFAKMNTQVKPSYPLHLFKTQKSIFKPKTCLFPFHTHFTALKLLPLYTRHDDRWRVNCGASLSNERSPITHYRPWLARVTEPLFQRRTTVSNDICLVLFLLYITCQSILYSEINLESCV